MANWPMERRTTSGELTYGAKVKKWRTGLWSEGQQVVNWPKGRRTRRGNSTYGAKDMKGQTGLWGEGQDGAY